MPKYKVIKKAEILDEIRTIGDEIEIEEETATLFVNDGLLELVEDNEEIIDGDNEETAVPPSVESPEDEGIAPPPLTEESPRDWIGNHSVL